MLRMLRLEEVFDVHVAKDGQEAYDMVKQSMEQNDKYDLIFMDVQVSSTFEFCTRRANVDTVASRCQTLTVANRHE